MTEQYLSPESIDGQRRERRRMQRLEEEQQRERARVAAAYQKFVDHCVNDHGYSTRDEDFFNLWHAEDRDDDCPF